MATRGPGLPSSSLLCRGLALLVASCASFDGAASDPGGPDAAADDASAPDANDADADPPDACAPRFGVLSQDTKSGGAICLYAVDGQVGARLGSGLNGYINGDNVNGCLRATFDPPVAKVEINAGLATQVCGGDCGNSCASSDLSVYSVAGDEYTLVTKLMLTSPPAPLPVTLPGPTRDVVVCRTNSVGLTADVVFLRATCP